MTGCLALLMVAGLVAPAVADVNNTRINEIRIDQTGSDFDEYFELKGDAGQSLDDVWYIIIGDYTAGSGVLEAAIDLTGYNLDGSGFFVAAEETFTLGTPDATFPGANPINFENSDNVTHLLVVGFDDANWALNDDLDTDDDGSLDFTPWTTELDRIALVEEDNPPTDTEYHYGPPQIGPDAGFVPGHVFRVPDGTGSWNIGEFDVEEGFDTPGGPNTNLRAENGVTLTSAGATGVAVELGVSGTFGTTTRLLSLPGAGEGTLKDDGTPIGSVPYVVTGDLTYDTPNGTFTGAPTIQFEAQDSVTTRGPANHVIAVQGDAVVISEIMHFPANEEDVFEYVEVYNYSGASVDLWGLAGDALTVTPVANLMGKSIPADSFAIIAPGGTGPEDEAFRCEWKLDEADIIRVDDDTWQTIRAETSLVMLFSDLGGGSAGLLDAVFVDHTNTSMWPTFDIPEDIGHAIAVVHLWLDPETLDTTTNDEVFFLAPWDKLGDVAPYINEAVQISESGLNYGSPGWVPTRNEGYMVPEEGCEFGECCLPNGQCIETYELDCTTNNCGVFAFDDGMCETDPPTCNIATGACCTPAGDCIEVSECECDLLDPAGYQGDGTTCGSVTCPGPTTVIINEIDYDNTDLDTDEFIELLGPASMDLSGWTIELYNGFGGTLYDTIALTGTIPADGLYVIGSDTVPNVDQIWDGETDNRIQNGSPDGMVLIDDTSTIVEALAYEGSFQASGGTADGMTLLDIGVTDEGRDGSVQRIPNGGFWTETPNKTPGEDNLAIVGACCSMGSCFLTTASECTGEGGFYQGDFSTCGLDPCADTCLTIAEAKALGVGIGVNLCDVVIHNEIDLVNSSSVANFQVQDATGGITVFGGNDLINGLLSGQDRGYQFDLTGTMDEYASLLELVEGDVLLERFNTDGFVGETYATIGINDLQDFSTSGETLESDAVELQCVIFEVADGVETFSGGTNYNVTDDGVQSGIVRVSTNDQDLVSPTPAVIPQGWVNVKGVFSQFDFNNPQGGYQLQVRELADITTCGTPPTGACCDGVGSTCIETDYYDCEVVQGKFFEGNGTTCDPNPCLPQGTCCLPTGACVVTDELDCLSEFGDWDDSSTDCGLAACTETEAIRINEIRVDQDLADESEYLELHGPADAPLWGMTYLVLGDGSGGSGVIEAVVEFGQTDRIPANGFFVAAETTFQTGVLGDVVDLELVGNGLNFENSDNVTHYLVTNFTGYDGQDLDTNDDGTLDIMPWATVVDHVALIEEANPPTVTEYHYGPPTVGPDGTFATAHAYRDMDGTGTWQIGDFDPLGQTDTPGCSNAGSGPCNVNAVRSYRLHDAARLGLDLTTNNVEPRGGIEELEIDLDDTCGLTGVTVDCNPAYTGTTDMSVDGNTVTLTFDPALPNQSQCTIMLDCGAEVCVRSLQGDVDRNGQVTTSDTSAVKPLFGQPASTSAATTAADQDLSGTVTTGDTSAIKPLFGQFAPACP